MPDSVGPFNYEQLPPEIQRKIGTKLSTVDLKALAATSTSSLFQPTLNQRNINKLLMHVVRDEYEPMQALLKKNIYWLVGKGKITDCSGRTFKNISPFKYVVWAMNEHMCAEMLQLIPKTQEGIALLEQLHAQCTEWIKNPVSYVLKKENITECYFDFKNTIIKEMAVLINLIQLNQTGSRIEKGQKSLEIKKYFLIKVGSAQKLLPMHVINEYFSDDYWWNGVPSFKSKPSGSKYIWGSYPNKFNDKHHAQLGVKIALCKPLGGGEKATGAKIIKEVEVNIAYMSLKRNSPPYSHYFRQEKII